MSRTSPESSAVDALKATPTEPSVNVPDAPASYDPAHFAPLFAAEDRHFWFRARNRIIATIAKQVTADLAPGYRVLEVGCGTGNVLQVLEQVCQRGVVCGMDLFGEGLSYARQRTSCALVQGDAHRPPFSAQFDVIGLFDVLEHLPDDLQVLRDLHGMLACGGRLLLAVPAHPSLWSYVDEIGHHCRRYQLKELESKLISTGYQIEYITQYMATIFPVVWLTRRLGTLVNRRAAKNGTDSWNIAANELSIVPVVNEVLAFLLFQEARVVARRRRLPIGTSLLAIARKVEN